MKVIERRVGNYSYPVHVESVSVKKGKTKKDVNFELYQVHGHLIDSTKRNVALLVKKEYVQKSGYIIVNNEIKKVPSSKWGLTKSVAEETLKAEPRFVQVEAGSSKKIKTKSPRKKASYGLSKMYKKRSPKTTKKWLQYYDELEVQKKTI